MEQPNQYLRRSISVGTDCPSEPDQPLTVLVNQFVRRDKRHIFAKWCREINLLAQHFEGFISTEVIRPTNESTIDSTSTSTATSSSSSLLDEFIAIVRFDNYSNLQRWMTSHERSSMMERVDEFSDKVPIFSYNSIEHWFTSNGTTGTQAGSTSNRNSHQSSGPPPRYKMWLVTCGVIYSQVVWVPVLTGLILPVNKLNPYIVKLINTVLTVTFSTFIFFPIITRLLSFWLFPKSNYAEKLLELVPFRRTLLKFWSSMVLAATNKIDNSNETSLLLSKE
jgi:uncharacterized protein